MLINNIFPNVINLDIISSNLTATISDDLPQLAIIPNNIYERGCCKLNRENFLKIDKLNVDNSTQIYLEKINVLLDTYAR